MRTWLSIISLWLALSPLTCLSAGEHGIQLTLNQSECFPGDVIELHAQMTRSDYAEFELKLPKIEALHFVTQQQSPITYSKGFYWQSGVWVFQPIRAGSIEWQGIRAILKQGANVTEYELPALQLEVLAYPSSVDSLTPEPLPLNLETNEAVQSPVWRYILLAAGGCSILYFALRQNSKKTIAGAAPAASLADLQRALQSDALPVTLIEQLLADEKVVRSPALRTALEAALYHPKADRDALRSEIVKELQS